MLRRAQLVARLRHPNLVRMLPLPGGAGLAPVLNDSKRLADFTLPAGTFKRFELEQIVRLLLDVLSGLAALHEVDVEGSPFVHGEVAPCNVFVDEHGTARLVPLVTSHLLAGLKPELHGYAAPERLRGDAFDCRADVFSVGAMLWEALSGQRLFPDATAEGVAARLATGVPQLTLGPRQTWATPLCAIAARAIAADPDARFGSVMELSNAIAATTAQQLSIIDSDAWQEEAPTPVFQPALHLCQRATTPEPQIIDLPPAPAAAAETSSLESTCSASRHGDEDQPAPAAPRAAPPVESWQRGRRGRGLLVTAFAVVLGAVAVTAPRASKRFVQVERRAAAGPVRTEALDPPLGRGPSAPVATSAAVPSPAPPPASRVPPLALPSPLASTKVRSSHDSSSEAPTSLPGPSNAAKVPRKLGPAKPAPSDYGI